MSEWTGMPMRDVLHLDWIDFLILRRDAYIFKLRGTERGRKYLARCAQMEKTEPDRAALRAQFGGKEG